MATVYVWGKYNAIKNEVKTNTTLSYNYEIDDGIDIASSYRVNDGSIELSSPTRVYFGSDNDKIKGSYTDIGKNQNGKYYELLYISSLREYAVGHFTISGPAYYLDEDAKYEKGSYISDVTSTNRSAYPDNDVSGSYWYIYKGVQNTAPTTPSSITVPSTLKENVAATISWGTSTDSDGNLSGYILEQQLNGGSWTQVYKGSARSKSITPLASWNTVAYRVKAYDSQNAMSSYKTSATVTVQHNSAPSMPEWCSVPNPVKGGTSIKITWPASTDPDNNLAGYILERKFNSNSWTQIYKGANRSYTDPIPLDKQKTVTYRVKAYDTKNAQSAYATSATRTIQNSTVLQFRLKTPIESSKRARYGQEIMTYTIPSGATFKAEACNNGFDENPTWEDVTEFVKKQKIFEFANKTKTASKWGYDIRVTVDRNGATGNCYFTRGNGFFEEEGYAPPPSLPEVGKTVDLFGYTWLVCHDDGTNKYLITKDLVKTVQWNTTNTTTGGYAASNIKKECTRFANTLGVNSLDYVIDTGVGKVFIPTKDQMTGESSGFSYFDSDSKRVAKYNGTATYYWTATPYDSSYVWCVTSDGGFSNYYTGASGSRCFRPAICVKYK